MTMGERGKNGVRNHNIEECQKIIDSFYAHGHKELDTARMYAEGTTEEVCANVSHHEYLFFTYIFISISLSWTLKTAHWTLSEIWIDCLLY